MALRAQRQLRWIVDVRERQVAHRPRCNAPVGLGHYEGRSWPGFHHQASLCNRWRPRPLGGALISQNTVNLGRPICR
jgi:hypothetical protein